MPSGKDLIQKMREELDAMKPMTQVADTGAQYSPEVMPEDVAKERGWVCRYPKENELFLDIDSEEAKKFAIGQIAVYRYLTNIFGIRPEIVKYTFTPSRTKGHYHGVLLMSGPVNHKDRIMLQALLGSEAKHELLSYARLFHSNRKNSPTVFYETDKSLKNEPYDKSLNEGDIPLVDDGDECTF